MGKLKFRDIRQLPKVTQQLRVGTGLPDPKAMLANHCPVLASQKCGILKVPSRTFSMRIYAYLKNKNGIVIHRRYGRILKLKGSFQPTPHLSPRGPEGTEICHMPTVRARLKSQLSKSLSRHYGLAQPLLLLLGTHKTLESFSKLLTR